MALTSRQGFTLSYSARFNAPCLCALVTVPSYVPLVAAGVALDLIAVQSLVLRTCFANSC